MAASDIVYIGTSLATLLEDYPAILNYDEFSIIGGELNYTVLYNAAPSLVNALKRHPDYSFMVRKSATITRMEAGMAHVKVKYEGLDPDQSDDDNTAVYSVLGSTESQAIETHEEFKDFAGLASEGATTWQNGATFSTQGDDQGAFLGFKPTAGTDAEGNPITNRKSGVTNYLDGSVIFQQVKTFGRPSGSSEGRADLSNLGKRVIPPNVDRYVDVEKPRDWLLISCNVDEVGDGIKVTLQFKLSGRNGWDRDIYPEGS